MPLSVTSWFVDQCAALVPTIVRKFTINASDYSSRVTRWPTISAGWNDLRPQTVTIGAANEDGAFNFFIDNKTTLTSSCTLKFGFTHPTSGDELTTLFAGTVDKVGYAKGECQISLIDRLRQLTQRTIGKSAAPVIWSGATQLPSHIAWWLCTSYGGFSATSGPTNPDIDHASFLAWAAVFSADTVYMQARFEGKPVIEGLRSVGRMTNSAIFMSQGKLAFYRFTNVNTNITSLDNTSIIDLTLSMDDADIVNRQYVNAAYAPASNYWTITPFDQSAASINSYGLHEDILKDATVWYVTSVHALNMAQRIMFTSGQPYERVQVKTPLTSLPMLIGETLLVQDSMLGIGAGWRIMEKQINMDDGMIINKIDGSQIADPFLLDTSILDGTDLLL